MEELKNKLSAYLNHQLKTLYIVRNTRISQNFSSCLKLAEFCNANYIVGSSEVSKTSFTWRLNWVLIPNVKKKKTILPPAANLEVFRDDNDHPSESRWLMAQATSPAIRLIVMDCACPHTLLGGRKVRSDLIDRRKLMRYLFHICVD